MVTLFQLGDFTLNSGGKSSWKLECDALTDADITCLARMMIQMVGPFGSVEGIPRGGERLAEELKRLLSQSEIPLIGRLPHLIVDDVLTTGGSLIRARDAHSGQGPTGRPGIIGAVIFARGQCPWWVKALFSMPECFWTKPKTRGRGMATHHEIGDKQ